MTRLNLRSAVSLTVLSAALACSASAFAADAPTATAAAPAASGAGDLLSNDTIIVTASGRDKTRIKSSVSVTSVPQSQIAAFTPRSEAEVFRLIPGLVVQDTAGPGGNANIGVRGIPVITGGSEFVQLQEDGLPTVLFGDIQFGNNDYWTRYDTNVERIEAVRGGGASTFASQAPGAVINYISDTGLHDGGSIGFSKALNYNENKVDVSYGTHITDSLRFHVGGFFKDGSGPTHIGYNAENGYQIKANITKELDDGKGFFRLYFKRLDDKEPTYTVSPSIASVSGNKITGFSPFPNYDARTGSNQSVLNQNFKVLNYDGTIATVPMEGIHVKETSFGAQLHYNFEGAFSVDDNVRWTEQSGVFRTQFSNVGSTAGIIGSTVNGQTVGSVVYASGPNQGKNYSGFVNNNPNIDTNMRDLGSLTNDLVLTGKFDVSGAKVTAKAGWFHMRQAIAMDWHVNRSYAELSGKNPAQLDLFTGPNGTGTQLTAAGQAGFNDNWGNCCARTYDLSYTDDAPYASLDIGLGKFDLDASVRYDTIKSSGTAQNSSGVAGPSFTVSDNLGSAVLPSLIPNGPVEVLSYRKGYTSYSVGALYAFDNNTSLFARISRGGRFNADRRTLGGNFNADGSLNAQGQATAVNFVQQQEVGVKRRGGVMGASYSVELTGFRTQLTDNNYDFTRITLGQNPVISNTYHSYGAEFTGAVRYGNFSIVADATLIHSRIVKTGQTPHATPVFIYSVSPSYDMGIAAIGFSANGQSSTLDDESNTPRHSIPGQSFVNGFVKVRPMKGLEVGINANNLFNTLGYRGAGSLSTVNGVNIFSNSAVLGRTFTGSINYKF